MALQKLSQNDLEWIKNEHQNGRTIEEIATDTGLSKQMVKRALAEVHELYLSWYKTKDENALLMYLKDRNIHTVEQLIASL